MTEVNQDPVGIGIPGGDWQSAKDFPETNWMMFTNQIACDVIFLVGEKRKKISAHKFILVSRSSVFLAMFYGPLAEKSQVEIPDCDAETFGAFMRFLYTNSVDVTTDTVVGLLYLGKKYSVAMLCQKCVQYLSSVINVDNACDILDQALLYGEPDLETQALKVINLNAVDVFRSSGFKDMRKSSLIKVLKSDDLRADEMEVFRATLWWSTTECRRQGRERTPENKCDVLGDAVNYVRFPLIGLESFGNHVGTLDKDWVNLLRPFFDMNVDKGDNTACSATVRPRKRQPCRIHRFESSETSVGWTFSNRTDAITFSCDSNVSLLGVVLYGAFPSLEADDTVPYNVVCSIEEDLRQDYQSHTFFKGGVVVEGTDIDKHILVNSQDEFIELYFENPVDITSGLKYTVLLNMAGPDSRRGRKGSSTVCLDGVEWTFYSSTKSKNSTDVEHGQIPGVIFSL